MEKPLSVDHIPIYFPMFMVFPPRKRLPQVPRHNLANKGAFGVRDASWAPWPGVTLVVSWENPMVTEVIFWDKHYIISSLGLGLKASSSNLILGSRCMLAIWFAKLSWEYLQVKHHFPNPLLHYDVAADAKHIKTWCPGEKLSCWALQNCHHFV